MEHSEYWQVNKIGWFSIRMEDGQSSGSNQGVQESFALKNHITIFQAEFYAILSVAHSRSKVDGARYLHLHR